jgi:hypothetical protein
VIERWSEGAADESMAEEILVDLADLIHGHPWWRARAALTLDLLGRLGIYPPAQVLDAGCWKPWSGAAITFWAWISPGGRSSSSTARADAWWRPTWLNPSARLLQRVTPCWPWT